MLAVDSKPKMIRHVGNPGIVRTVYSDIFKYIEGYSGILMNVHPESGIILFAKRSILII